MVTQSSVPRRRIIRRRYRRAINTAQPLLHPLDAFKHARVVILRLSRRVQLVNRYIVVRAVNVGTGRCPTLLQLAEAFRGKAVLLIDAASPSVW